ncbi:DUF2150 family protein [Salinirubellus salinus]|uniref:DUF2150 family protein n=1 Tax=Salinirubellus salinus TaxID=1364945 RepID=A0A9E7R436_9EURY|nr:DUF2150 family protein [Salinirubellus salinus]UWM55475.1 DUF2150 family protein [Salinirubellus salinus]
MSESGAYYTEERWNNWLDRLREEDVDPEDEDAARLFFNLMDDAAIAVAKVLTELEEGELDAEAAQSELERIREIVMTEVEFDDEEKLVFVDTIQTSLLSVFYAAEEYVAAGPAEEGTPEEYVEAAADAEAEEDVDAALMYCVQAGTLIIDGEEFDTRLAEEIEYGYVANFVDGLTSLQEALADPELVEEED